VKAVQALYAILRPVAPPQSGRRVLLSLILAVVALSVIGMHQLSLSHSFATPEQAGQRTSAAGPAISVHNTMAVGAIEPTGPLVDASSTPPAGSTDHDDRCPGCGGHPMPFSACLLALTLLVLFWWLAPPRMRHLPPHTAWRPAALRVVVARRVPALTLAELSILRT
jgi:hypothetical protein